MSNQVVLSKAMVAMERRLAREMSKAFKDLLFSIDHPDEINFDLHYKNAKDALVAYEAYWFSKGS